MDKDLPPLEELVTEEMQRERDEDKRRPPVEEEAPEEPAGATGGPQAEAESDLREGRDVP